jgi:hypothetical protein
MLLARSNLLIFSNSIKMHHISDHDLERYYLGQVREEIELAGLEEHLLWCASCHRRMAESGQYIDAMRAAMSQSQ